MNKNYYGGMYMSDISIIKVASKGDNLHLRVAAGHFASLEDAVDRCRKVVSVTKPNPENTVKYAELFKRYKKIHDALAPIYNER